MLQRSVTETRRLVSGRPNVSRSTSDMGGSGRWTTGGIDPHFTAVRAQLLLPHGHAPLHLFDHVAARLERLRPVRRRRDDRDARLAHLEPPQPVTHVRSGESWPTGSSARTRRTTSPTWAGSGTATAASARPTSSA